MPAARVRAVCVTTVTATVNYKIAAAPAAHNGVSLPLQFPSANGKLDSTPIVLHILGNVFFCGVPLEPGGLNPGSILISVTKTKSQAKSKAPPVS
jgi:hypothetical protein